MPGLDPGGSGCPTRCSFLKPRLTGRKKRVTVSEATTACFLRLVADYPVPAWERMWR